MIWSLLKQETDTYIHIYIQVAWCKVRHSKVSMHNLSIATRIVKLFWYALKLLLLHPQMTNIYRAGSSTPEIIILWSSLPWIGIYGLILEFQEVILEGQISRNFPGGLNFQEFFQKGQISRIFPGGSDFKDFSRSVGTLKKVDLILQSISWKVNSQNS